MKTQQNEWLVGVALLAAALLVPQPGRAGTYSWSAESGLTPDQVEVSMELFRFNTVGTPSLSTNGLVIATTSGSEMQYYQQGGTNIAMPSQLLINADLRVVSDVSSLGVRAAASIGFTTSPNIGSVVFFGTDEVFWLASSGARGGTAAVDTDGAFHQYRIEVNGTAAGSPFTVFQDGSAILSGSLPPQTSPPIADPQPGIYFGDGTQYSHGTASWRFFSHNASVSGPEPPKLSLSSVDNEHARITWPTNAVGYALQFTTSLPAPTWNTITDTPAVIGDQFALIVDTTVGSKYYRLRKP